MTSKSSKAGQIAGGIITFLKKSKSAGLLPEIINLLQRERDMQSVKIISPVELTKDQKNRLETKLNSIWGVLNYKPEFYTDSSLIDGLKIYYKDNLWDLSVNKNVVDLLGSNDI